MGNLPECRLEVGMVFRNTEVDFFGPMLVKEKRSEVKVFGCLFVCLHEYKSLVILSWWMIFQQIISLWH